MSKLSRFIRRRRSAAAPAPPPPPPPTPYEHLLWQPRYQPTTEQLVGDDFLIADGPSFYASYCEIFQREIYRFRASTPSPRIVDCGANYGVSVLYFKQLFPAARIVAVEADPAIFHLLEQNITRRQLTDVRLVNRCVATHDGTVTFHREGADAGRTHALDGAEGISVPAVAIDDLLSEPVDLLKLDVEGDETDLLRHSRLLGNVSQLFVEYHSFADSEQTLAALLETLARHGFRYYVQTQFCAPRPLDESQSHMGMDLQLNIFATRTPLSASGATDPTTPGDELPQIAQDHVRSRRLAG